MGNHLRAGEMPFLADLQAPAEEPDSHGRLTTSEVGFGSFAEMYECPLVLTQRGHDAGRLPVQCDGLDLPAGLALSGRHTTEHSQLVVAVAGFPGDFQSLPQVFEGTVRFGRCKRATQK